MKKDHITEIKELIELFRFERITYLCITVGSLIILIVVAISLLTKGNSDPTLFYALFLPTGAIGITSSRLLKMWSDSIDYLGKFSLQKGDNKNG